MLDRQIIEAEIAKLTDIIEQPLAQSSPPISPDFRKKECHERHSRTCGFSK